MTWLKSIFHDLFGHPTALKHGSGCSTCQERAAAFCPDCDSHFVISEPPIGGFR